DEPPPPRPSHPGSRRRRARRPGRFAAPHLPAPARAVQAAAQLARRRRGLLARSAVGVQGPRRGRAGEAAVSLTDSVTVTSVVALAPGAAFAVFTDEIDAWWRRGSRFRFRDGEDGTLAFAGGRLVESYAGGDRFEVGRVLDWQPG